METYPRKYRKMSPEDIKFSLEHCEVRVCEVDIDEHEDSDIMVVVLEQRGDEGLVRYMIPMSKTEPHRGVFKEVK